jgi:hypothetical protein
LTVCATTLCLGAGQHVCNGHPQLLPRFSFRLKKLAQGVLAANAGQIAVVLPVPHRLHHLRPDLVRILGEFLPPSGQIAPWRVQHLLAQACLFLGVELRHVLALAAGCQGLGAGSVVTVAGPQVGEPLVCGKGLGEPAGRGVVLLVHQAQEGQLQALPSVGRLHLAFQDLEELLVPRPIFVKLERKCWLKCAVKA